MNNYEELWSGVLDTLRENISEQGFNTWFSETQIIDLEDNKLSVKVPTQFIADYLNSNYSELVSEICFNLFNNKYSIRFTGINPAKPEKRYSYKQKPKEISSFHTKLNKKYNFNEFVIGTNNSFAHSASLAVAESPGTTYNPLFIYGE